MRFLLKEKGDPKDFTVILQFTIALTLLLIIPLENITYLFSTSTILVIILVGIGAAIMGPIFTAGRQLEEASNVSIGVQIGNVWNLFGAWLILGEPLTLYKVLGVSNLEPL